MGSCSCSGDFEVLGGFWIQTCTHSLCPSSLEPSPLTCHLNFTKTHFGGKWSDCHMNLGISFRATFSRIYSAPGSGHGWCEWHNYRGNLAENKQIWVNVRCIQLLWGVLYTFSFGTQDAWVVKTAQGTLALLLLHRQVIWVRMGHDFLALNFPSCLLRILITAPLRSLLGLLRLTWKAVNTRWQCYTLCVLCPPPPPQWLLHSQRCGLADFQLLCLCFGSWLLFYFTFVIVFY